MKVRLVELLPALLLAGLLSPLMVPAAHETPSYTMTVTPAK
jgi:hypothetical protein